MSEFVQRLQALRQKEEKDRKIVEDLEQEEIENEIAGLPQNYAHKEEHIPDDVWEIIQDNGRLATKRLNELLTSHRFHRYKASDQAKLISLAQDRAYGKPNPGIKKVVKATIDLGSKDATNASIKNLRDRLRLPEYGVVDAEVISDPVPQPAGEEAGLATSEVSGREGAD